MAKKKEEAPAPGAPAWMATFSDLMNLLLCFFVLLFAMSNTDESKAEQIVASFNNSFSIFKGGGTAINEGELVSSGVAQLNILDQYIADMGKQVEEDSEEKVVAEINKRNEAENAEIAEAIEKAAEEKKIEEFIEISYDAQFVRLTISGGILFDSAKATIKEEAIPIVNKLGDILLKYNIEYMIEIEGHTDNLPINKGIFTSNLVLSSFRAMAVQDHLIEKKSLTPQTLKSSGRSEWDPIADNNTVEGRAKNRRVEIKIYKPDK